MGEGWREVRSVDSVTKLGTYPGDGRKRRGAEVPNAEEGDDGLIADTGDTRALGRHGGHDSRVDAEEARRPAESWLLRRREVTVRKS